MIDVPDNGDVLTLLISLQEKIVGRKVVQTCFVCNTPVHKSYPSLFPRSGSIQL